jgi:hypothetical protein
MSRLWKWKSQKITPHDSIRKAAEICVHQSISLRGMSPQILAFHTKDDPQKAAQRQLRQYAEHTKKL